MASDPPDVDAFYRMAWEIVRQVPSGKVTTYGQIAAMIPCPQETEEGDYLKQGPRWVGSAMNAISGRDDPTIPWHRVINSKGGVSLPPESRSGRMQRERLVAEGVAFDEKGRVDFRAVGWKDADPEWLEKKGLYAPRPLTPEASPEDNGPQQLTLF